MSTHSAVSAHLEEHGFGVCLEKKGEALAAPSWDLEVEAAAARFDKMISAMPEKETAESHH